MLVPGLSDPLKSIPQSGYQIHGIGNQVPYQNMATYSMEKDTRVWLPIPWKQIPQNGYHNQVTKGNEYNKLVTRSMEMDTRSWLQITQKIIPHSGYQIHGNGYQNLVTKSMKMNTTI